MPDAICLKGCWLRPSGEFVSGFVITEGGKISQTGVGSPPIKSTFTLPPDSYILPGFIDLQINGAFGVDLQLDIGGIALLSKELPKHGVTSFLPTIVSSPLDRYHQIFAACDLTPAPSGALPLGLHIEGPFLNPKYKGAHDPTFLRAPLPQDLALLLRPELVRIITFASDLPGGLDAASRIQDAGIVAAIGHSGATYDEAREAFKAGIGYGTHLFNAMPTLHHRQPGLACALLEATSPPAGIIVDGIHIHPAMLRLAFAARGANGLTLVSDAMAAAGLGEGTFSIGSQLVNVNSTGAHLKDGTLAGSAILLDEAVNNTIKFGICALADAAHMASYTPASVLGMADHKGLIEIGYDADLTVLDHHFEVHATIIQGKIAFMKS